MEPSFFKMSGSGNDFIIIDNRKKVVDRENVSAWVKKICARKVSVGADGLILIEDSRQADFKWSFFNSDGSRAEMCGNGARCAARFAYINGIAGASMSFETDAGIIDAKVTNDRVSVKMSDPSDFMSGIQLETSAGMQSLSFINTGVPHAVIVTDDIDNAPVTSLGREIRFHSRFAPAGTNVNFIRIKESSGLLIRTYERGVEDETLACGTGSVAAAIVAAVNHGLKPPVRVFNRGGGMLTIDFKIDPDGFHDVYMEGDARIIYKADLHPDATDY